MDQKMGIEELKQVVGAVVDVVDLGVAVGKDGIGKEDVVTLFAAMPKLISSIGAGIEGAGKIPAELQDLSVEEAAELAAFVIAKLAVDDAKAKLIVEKSLKVAVAGFDLAKAIAG